jgi:hypothetical protein
MLDMILSICCVVLIWSNWYIIHRCGKNLKQIEATKREYILLTNQQIGIAKDLKRDLVIDAKRDLNERFEHTLRSYTLSIDNSELAVKKVDLLLEKFGYEYIAPIAHIKRESAKLVKLNPLDNC